VSDLKALARRLYDEVMNTGNVDLIDEVTTEDFVEHEALPGAPAGREAPKQMIGMTNEAFSDFRMVIEDMIEEGNKVVARIRMRGTHTGDFMGIPASGNEIDVPAIDVLEFRGDLIAAHWGVTDMAAMMQQMGVGGPPA
jgi:steroid delta-isomerase-like uncharacterized protein